MGTQEILEEHDNPTLSVSKRGEIIINPDRFRELMRQRGWKGYPQAAKALGITRQRIQQIMTGSAVSSEFIATLALVTGTAGDKSYTYYLDIRPLSNPDNHQRWNMAKNKGEHPYEKYSVAAAMRERDYPVERKELDTKKYGE